MGALIREDSPEPPAAGLAVHRVARQQLPFRDRDFRMLAEFDRQVVKTHQVLSGASASSRAARGSTAMHPSVPLSLRT